MKVAILSTFLGQKTSGAEISALHLAQTLNKHESAVVITTKKTHQFDLNCYDMPATRKIPNMILHIGSSVLDKYLEIKIKKILKKEKVDIVHIQDYPMMIPAIKAARKYNIPAVMTVRDYRFVCNLSRCFEKDHDITFRCNNKQNYKRCLTKSIAGAYTFPAKGLAAKLALPWFKSRNSKIKGDFTKLDGYITVSDYVKNKMIESGVSREKVRTIKVQKESWTPKEREEENKEEEEREQKTKTSTIFSAGGLKKSKGFEDLIRAFKIVLKDKPDAILRIAGDGSAKADLINLTKSLGIENRVTFLGNIAREKMKEEYENADFVVSPSIWPEPLSRIIFETFSMRKTIVATNVGGSPELVIPKKTGVLVNPNNPKSMAQGIMELINDPVKRKEYEDAAFVLINQESAPSRVYEQHISMYKEIIANAHKKIT